MMIVSDITFSSVLPIGVLFPHPIQVGLFVFVLATFVGMEIIHKVPQMLHTPLMSGANAISGVTVVGALAAVGAVGATSDSVFANLLGCAAIAFATVNVVGGFAVTDRMIKMFKGR